MRLDQMLGGVLVAVSVVALIYGKWTVAIVGLLILLGTGLLSYVAKHRRTK